MAPPQTPQLASKDSRIALAAHTYQDSQFLSRRGAADAYGLPESSLRYRAQGHPTRRDTPPASRKLTDTEELILI